MTPLALRPELDGIGQILFLLLLVLSVTIHEVAHGWVALQFGDTTARDLGRLTLNPLPHIDLFMTILLPAMLLISGTGFLFGGAKPVPVAFHRLRHPWRDMMLVSLAGPGSNFLLAVFFYFLLGVLLMQGVYEPSQRLPLVLHSALQLNLLLAIFNLVPIPPLDGSRVMAWLLPEGIRPSYLAIERFGLLILIGLIFFGPRLGLPDLSLWVNQGVRWLEDVIAVFASWFGIR
jgi:Zn-dependent protease